MKQEISPENEQFVQAEVAAGHYRDRMQVLDEAVRLLRRKHQLLQEVNAGVEQLNAGQFVEFDVQDQEPFVQHIREAAKQNSQLDNESA